MAHIVLSFDAWKDGRVSPATVEVPVAVLDVTDSKQIRATLKGHTDPILAATFSPDGATLATTAQGVIKLWDVDSLKGRRTLTQPGIVLGLAFLPDGRTLAASWYEVIGQDGRTLKPPYKAADMKGYRGGVKLWDVTTGKERGVWQRPSPRGVSRIALSPDGKTLAELELWREKDDKKWESGIALWDVATGKVRSDIPDKFGALAFAPDSKTLAIVSDGSVLLWDVVAGRQRAVFSREKLWPNALAFAPDGKTLAGADFQGTVTLWDVASGKVKSRLQHAEGQPAYCLAFSPDGTTLAVGVGPRNPRVIEAGEVVMWDVAAAKKRLTLRGHVGSIYSVAFSPDGKLLVSGGADKTVKLWNVAPIAASRR